jgi:hypothetical protein
MKTQYIYAGIKQLPEAKFVPIFVANRQLSLISLYLRDFCGALLIFNESGFF